MYKRIRVNNKKKPQIWMIKNYYHIKILNLLDEHFKCFLFKDVSNLNQMKEVSSIF